MTGKIVIIWIDTVVVLSEFELFTMHISHIWEQFFVHQAPCKMYYSNSVFFYNSLYISDLEQSQCNSTMLVLVAVEIQMNYIKTSTNQTEHTVYTQPFFFPANLIFFYHHLVTKDLNVIVLSDLGFNSIWSRLRSQFSTLFIVRKLKRLNNIILNR